MSLVSIHVNKKKMFEKLLITVITDNSAHSMNNIDMSRIGQCVELSSSIVFELMIPKQTFLN